MTMKLSKKTIDVLKNFASINSNFLFQKGTKQSTVAVANNIFANATIDEDIPQDFAIYNLNEFLGALSLFQDPQLEFDSNVVKISSSNSKSSSLKFVAADRAILHVPTKEVKEPKYDLTFDLSADILGNIIKSSAVIGASDVLICGGTDGLKIVVCDKKNRNSNDFEITDELWPDPEAEFTYALKVENLKLLPGSYEVSISGKGLSKFKNVDKGSITFIALEL